MIELITKGGFVIWPILLCAIIVFSVIVEKIIYFKFTTIDHREFEKAIIKKDKSLNNILFNNKPQVDVWKTWFVYPLILLNLLLFLIFFMSWFKVEGGISGSEIFVSLKKIYNSRTEAGLEVFNFYLVYFSLLVYLLPVFNILNIMFLFLKRKEQVFTKLSLTVVIIFISQFVISTLIIILHEKFYLEGISYIYKLYFSLNTIVLLLGIISVKSTFIDSLKKFVEILLHNGWKNAAPVVIAEAYMNSIDLSLKNRELVLKRTGKMEIEKMEKYIVLLSTIASVAPLLGLLGTATGIIKCFIEISKAGGQVEMNLLAGGIWEAMLTTAAGLSVAIPAHLSYHIFQKIIERRGNMMSYTIDYLDEKYLFKKEED